MTTNKEASSEMLKHERVKSFQDVYDLIIITCQHDPEFHAWGASALRFLNRVEDRTSSTTVKGDKA